MKKVAKKLHQPSVAMKHQSDFAAQQLTPEALNAFLEQAPAAIAILHGPTHIFTFANHFYQQLFHRTKKQLLGKTIKEVFPEIHDQGIYELFDEVFNSGRPYQNVSYPATFDRSGTGTLERRYFNFIAKPLRDNSGAVQDIIVHATEVTEHVLTQNKIAENEEKYRTLFRSIDQGFCIVEVLFDSTGKAQDYVFLEVNPMFERQTGIKRARGKSARELIPRLEPFWFETYGNVALTGKAKRFIQKSDAMGRWFEVYVFRIGGKNSRKIAILFSDYTERRNYEEQLRNSRQQLELITDTLPVLISYVDKDLRYQFNNKEYERWFGKKKSEIHGKTLQQVLGRRAFQDVKPHVETVLSGKAVSFESLVPYKQGGDRHILASYIPHRGKDKEVLGFYALVTDITQRKHAEEQLRESEERFRHLADSMPQLVWTANSDGQVDYYNARKKDFSGLKRVGRQYSWSPIVHPDDLEKTWDAWREAVQNGSTYEMEHRIKYKKLGYRWFLSRAAPIRNEKGEIVKWYGTATDIEELKRKHYFEQRIKNIIEQRNQLVKLNKSKDEFIALASHQLRTPASAVKQYISMLMDHYAGPVTDAQMQYLKTAYESNERQLNVINELLKIAQIDRRDYTLNKKSQDIISIVRDVITNFNSILDLKNQQIIFKPVFESFPIMVDGPEIKLALINLIENASKYSYPNTTIRIDVSKSGGFVHIAVSDEGIGISKEDSRRIFEKFTRLSNDLDTSVVGTGLGLYWVKRIVRLHKGTVHVEPAPKKGSTFIVSLPYE